MESTSLSSSEREKSDAIKDVSSRTSIPTSSGNVIAEGDESSKTTAISDRKEPTTEKESSHVAKALDQVISVSGLDMKVPYPMRNMNLDEFLTATGRMKKTGM